MHKKGNDFRILVVDDNIELRSIIVEYLGSEGDAVEGASDGKEALDRHGEKPFDLIITDLNMPKVSGIEMMKTIRENNDLTEFVIVTGYASLDSAVDAVKLGAFDYIVKPFRMEELKVAVKNVKDKILLKKANKELFLKLKGIHKEIERYRQTIEPKERSDDPVRASDDQPGADYTEKIVNEIKNLEKLIKGRLLID